MALRALYTDLDGTLLGRRGSLFHDAEGNFSKAQSRTVEACHRAGVEIVIMSGRREAQVLADSRLIGQSSYIYEAGCGMVIDGERTLLIGGWEPEGEETVAERIISAGVAELLFERYPGLLEWHHPWQEGRELSLLFRGKVDAGEADALIREAGHMDLRFLDNGAIVSGVPGIEIAHAYHVVPGGASKGQAVAAHMRARGYLPEECIGAGDSLEDLAVAEHVERFFVVANGVERDQGLRAAIGNHANVRATEGHNGEGVYEAVVSTLAGAP